MTTDEGIVLPDADGVTQSDDWVAWDPGRSSRHSKHGSGHHHHHHRRHRRHIARRIVVVVVVVLVVALLGCTAAFAWSAYGVVTDAQELMGEADTLEEGLSEGDVEAIQSSAAAIEEEAASMGEAVDGPLWAVASALPGIGTDVSNVRSLAWAMEELSTGAITPLAEQAGSFDLSAVLSEDEVDVDAIVALADAFSVAAPAVESAAETVDGLEEGSIDEVNEVVESVEEPIGTLNSLCTGLDELSPYLEDMLGANGKRTYLVLAHNTSELKSSGGFTGSVGTLTVTDGIFKLGKFSTFSSADRDADGDLTNRADVTDEEDALFTWSYGQHAGDSGVNPDFPREAELSKEMWESVHKGTVDGVFALDSAVLQDFLSAAGASATSSDGTTVDGSTCSQVLGHDIYWDYFSSGNTSKAGEKTDRIFAELAGLAFDQIVDNIGSVGVLGLADVLSENAGEKRFLAWMLDEDEEQALDELGASGAIGDDEAAPELGVYLETRLASKLSWWTTCDTVYSQISVNDDGSVSYSVTTTIGNTITSEEVDAVDASRYIVGRLEGENYLDVYLYAPAGGSISDIQSSYTGEAGDPEYFTIDGVQVGKVFLTVEPESTQTITYTVTTSPSSEEELSLRTTPLAQTGEM